MKDKYDQAVKYLTTHPEKIYMQWIRGADLFQFAHRMPQAPYACGCITMIKGGGYHAQTPEITAAIKDDPRIPEDVDDITPENLPVFAEWQRRLDRDLGGKEVE